MRATALISRKSARNDNKNDKKKEVPKQNKERTIKGVNNGKQEEKNVKKNQPDKKKRNPAVRRESPGKMVKKDNVSSQRKMPNENSKKLEHKKPEQSAALKAFYHQISLQNPNKSENVVESTDSVRGVPLVQSVNGDNGSRKLATGFASMNEEYCADSCSSSSSSYDSSSDALSVSELSDGY